MDGGRIGPKRWPVPWLSGSGFRVGIVLYVTSCPVRWRFNRRRRAGKTLRSFSHIGHRNIELLSEFSFDVAITGCDLEYGSVPVLVLPAGPAPEFSQHIAGDSHAGGNGV